MPEASNWIRVWVDNLMKEGSVIFWDITPEGCGPEPVGFTAEWARSPTDEFTVVNPIPVFNTYYVADPVQKLFAKNLDLWYRVKVDNGEEIFTSEAVRADGGMSKSDWLTAREITRLEYLHMIKGPSGIKGCLLKRRNWGTRCPVCTDHDTGSVLQDNCSTCYGTGIVGGYCTAVDFWILVVPPARKSTRDPKAGHRADTDVQARCVAYPYVNTGDVWVSNETGRRYIIGEGSHQIREVTRVKNKPVVLIIDMGLAPATHIVYDVPLEACAQDGTYRQPEGNPYDPAQSIPEYQAKSGGRPSVPDY